MDSNMPFLVACGVIAFVILICIASEGQKQKSDDYKPEGSICSRCKHFQDRQRDYCSQCGKKLKTPIDI